MEQDQEWIDRYYAASPEVRIEMRGKALAEGTPPIWLSAFDLFVSIDERITKLEKEIEVLRRWT